MTMTNSPFQVLVATTEQIDIDCPPIRIDTVVVGDVVTTQPRFVLVAMQRGSRTVENGIYMYHGAGQPMWRVNNDITAVMALKGTQAGLWRYRGGYWVRPMGQDATQPVPGPFVGTSNIAADRVVTPSNWWQARKLRQAAQRLERRTEFMRKFVANGPPHGWRGQWPPHEYYELCQPDMLPRVRTRLPSNG